MSAITPETRHIGAVGVDGEVAADETISLIAFNRVEGTAVYDRAGNRLGSVFTAMINKLSGQIAYVVIGAGGPRGIEYSALPWESLIYNPLMGGYVVDTMGERVREEPRYAFDAQPWIDPRFGEFRGMRINTPE
jgi:hypothetical protein